MKVIQVMTERNSSHDSVGNPVVEKILQTIESGFKWDKFLKYLPYHGYRKVTVLGFIDAEFNHSDSKKELNKSENEDLQSQVDKALKVDEVKTTDFKAALELEKKRNDELAQRLAALEAKLSGGSERDLLETKAKELGISFRNNIGDEKLLEKIKEIEPDFNIN